MKDERLKHLHDIREAATAIKSFVDGKSFANYHADEMLRSAVERKFEIIGEAAQPAIKNRPGNLGRDTQSSRHHLLSEYPGSWI